MGFERPTTWVVIAIVALILFGYNKLPDAARSVGRSLRIFKSEMKGMSEDDKAREQAREAAAQSTSAQSTGQPTDSTTAVPSGPTVPAEPAPAVESAPETVHVPPATGHEQRPESA